MMNSKSLYCLILFFLVGVPFSASAQRGNVKLYSVQVEKSFPHDRGAYTQGLFFYEGVLYETTGQYGESSIRKIDYESGDALIYIPVDRNYFLEGSCVLNGQMFILTWKEHLCFVYDINTMKPLGVLRNSREGWGLTTDGNSLIMSDGSHNIYFLDSMTFMEKKKIEVKMDGKKIWNINELEYIDGKIWANVYTTDVILIINPDSGEVEGKIDCKNLLSANLKTYSTDVLNGIAWDSKTKSVYLTGKNWPRLYRISLKEKR